MILFDFDGVLVDSVDEIAISAYNLLTGAQIISIKQLPPTFTRLFFANRHLLLNPPRVVLLAQWCLKSSAARRDCTTQLKREEFLEYIQISGGEDQTVTDKFYSTRQWLIDHHPQDWLESNRPFQAIWSALRKYSGSYAILTFKNKSAVKLIADHFDLGLDLELIFSGEGGRTKQENILQLHRRFNAPNYILIDDA